MLVEHNYWIAQFIYMQFKYRSQYYEENVPKRLNRKDRIWKNHMSTPLTLSKQDQIVGTLLKSMW